MRTDIPVSLDMLLPVNNDEYGIDEDLDSAYSKSKEYMSILRDITYTPKKWMNKLDEQTLKYKKIKVKDKEDRFLEECENLYLQGISNKDIFEIIYETTEFSIQDWYFLFLLNRAYLGESIRETVIDVEGKPHYVGEKGFEVWNYLSFLEGK